jgi:membrane-associated phospholipid phosphatase
MPADLTIFAANYFVFIEAVVTAGAVGLGLYQQSRDNVLRWLMAAGVTGVTAEVFTQIGGALYNDPRPFVGHFKPLIAHVADNGFPSDHALLAAFLVVCVLLARAWLAVPPVVALAVLVDWARAGAGIHHPIDVIGSDVFVAAGALIGFALTPFLSDLISPHLPRVLSGPEPASAWRESPGRGAKR